MQIRSTTAKDCPSPAPSRQRRQRQLPTPKASPSLEFLPDDVLLAIGLSVAKLCGARDFLALSKTSNRLQHLLVDSHETVHEILQFQTARMHRSLKLPSWCSNRKNSSTGRCRRRQTTNCSAAAPAVVVQNLEQLQVYESLENLELLEEHRILGIVGCSSNNRSNSGGEEHDNHTTNNNHNSSSNIVEIYDTWDLHRCLGMVVRAMERKLPTVVLDDADSHDCCARHRMQDHLVQKSTRTAAASSSSVSMHMEKTKHYLHHDSYFCGKAVYKVLLEHLLRRRNEASKKNGFHWISCCSNEDTSERFLIRCWRDTNATVKTNTTTTNNKNEDTQVLVARRGTGWVEVFFKMVVAGDESDIGLPEGARRLDELLRSEDELWPHEP